MTTRPTPEQIAGAREWVRSVLPRISKDLGPLSLKHVSVLLAATEPPTDEEIVNFSNKHYSGLGKGCMVAAVRHFLGQVKP